MTGEMKNVSVMMNVHDAWWWCGDARHTNVWLVYLDRL